MTRLPTGSLVITIGKDGPHWEGKWRWDGRQIKRRIGPAWLVPAEAPERDPVGEKFASNGRGPDSSEFAGDERDPGSGKSAGTGQRWKKRPGRPQEGFLSREDAIVALRSMIAAHAAQEAQDGPESAPTFAQAAELWYQRSERRQRKPATLAAYQYAVRVVKGAPFAQKPITAVSKRDMRTWFDGMEHSRTKERLYKFVKSICDFAVAEEWIIESPAKSVDCHTVPYDGDLDFYSADEIDRLIAAAADDYDAALYACAAFTGLRRGELLALQWGDVDLEHSRLVVRRNLTHGQLLTPKSGKVRVVPLVPALATRLKALKLSSGRITGTSHVFANPKRARAGHPWANPAALGKRYHAALKRAKLRSLPFHSLRHSFGSHAVNVTTLVQVKAWMGHSSIMTTSRYLHSKNLDSDADLLAAAFKDSNPT